eukprot:360252-Chlamydomonas_euryale.AAC.12
MRPRGRLPPCSPVPAAASGGGGGASASRRSRMYFLSSWKRSSDRSSTLVPSFCSITCRSTVWARLVEWLCWWAGSGRATAAPPWCRRSAQSSVAVVGTCVDGWGGRWAGWSWTVGRGRDCGWLGPGVSNGAGGHKDRGTDTRTVGRSDKHRTDGRTGANIDRRTYGQTDGLMAMDGGLPIPPSECTAQAVPVLMIPLAPGLTPQPPSTPRPPPSFPAPPAHHVAPDADTAADCDDVLDFLVWNVDRLRLPRRVCRNLCIKATTVKKRVERGEEVPNIDGAFVVIGQRGQRGGEGARGRREGRTGRHVLGDV